MKKAVWLIAFTVGIAFACELVGEIVTPTVQVSGLSSPSEKIQQIGSKLESWYGNTHKDNEAFFRVPVQTCLFGVCGRSLQTHVNKLCGETVKQAFDRISESVVFEDPTFDSGSGGLSDPGDVLAGGGLLDDPFSMCTSEPKTQCITVSNGTPECVSYTVLNCPS